MTLVEMMVICAVITIIAGIVFPRLLASQASDNYRRSLQQLESAANNARSLAIRNGRTYILKFDSSSQSISVEPDNPDEDTPTNPNSTTKSSEASSGDSVGNPITTSLGSDWSLSETTSTLDNSTDTNLDIRFYADGSADAKSAQFRAGDVDVVLNVSQTGQVEVKRGTVESNPVQEWEAGELEQRTG